MNDNLYKSTAFYKRRRKLMDEGVPLRMLPKYRQGNNNTAVLIFHSLTSSTLETDNISDLLEKQGYSVFQCLVEGHGFTHKRLRKTSKEEWLSTALEDFNSAKKMYTRVGVIGISTGGLFAIRLAAKYNTDFCVTIAPALNIPKKFVTLAFLLRHIYWYKKNRTIKDISSWYLTHMPLTSVWSVHLLAKSIKKILSDIKCPVLSIHSLNDSIIKFSSSSDFLINSSSHNINFITLSRDLHIPVLPCGRKSDYALSRICVFIKKQY